MLIYTGQTKQRYEPRTDKYSNYIALDTSLTPNLSSITNNTSLYLDESTAKANAIEVYQGRFSPFYGEWGAYFPAGNVGMSFASTGVDDFGTGDFTVEMWVYPVAKTQLTPVVYANHIGSPTSSSLIIRPGDTSSFNLWAIKINTTTYYSKNTIRYNEWCHIAVVRYNGVISFYINGLAEVVVPANFTIGGGSSTSFIGGAPLAANATIDSSFLDYSFNGYITNFHICKSALYTSAFTPHVAAPIPIVAKSTTTILGLQKNYFTRSYPTGEKLTPRGAIIYQPLPPPSPGTAAINSDAGSVFFANPYFYNILNRSTIAVDPEIGNFGGKDFTIEAWIFLAQLPTQDDSIVYPDEVFNIYSQKDYLDILQWTTGNMFSFFVGKTKFGITHQGVNYNSSAVHGLVPNRWHYIAASRNGPLIRFYVNTAFKGSVSFYGKTISPSKYANIGNNYYGPIKNAYLSNFKITKEQALYYSEFNSTISLTAATPYPNTISSTNNNFLLNFNNEVGWDKTNNAHQVINGVVEVRNNQTKFNSSSLYLNGNADFVSMYSASAYDICKTKYNYPSSLTNTCYTLNITGGTTEFDTTTSFATNSAEDIFYNQTAIILNFDGPNNSTSLVNSSKYNITLTALSSAKISTAVYKYGTGSLMASSTTGRGHAVTDSSEPYISLGDFTVEGWFYPNVTTTGEAGLIAKCPMTGTNPWLKSPVNLGTDSSGGVYVTLANAAGSGYAVVINTTGYRLPGNEWTHLAVVRQGANIILYKNREVIKKATLSVETSLYAGEDNVWQIGGHNGFGSGRRIFNGYVDGVRITAGVARYPRIEYYSIDFWVYRLRQSMFERFLQLGTTEGNPDIFFIAANADDTLNVNNGINAGTITSNQWNHIAVVNVNRVNFAYINGVQVGTYTYAPLTSSCRYLTLGSSYYNSYDSLSGYIDDVRITRHAARYTKNFNVPTTKSPALPYSPVGVWSNYFSGQDGCYLKVPDSREINISTASFTIEGWFFPTESGGTSYSIFNKIPASPSIGPIYISHINQNINLLMSYSGAGWDINQNFGTINLNQWNHFAVSRSGNTVMAYLNGVGTNISLTQSLQVDSVNDIAIGGRAGNVDEFKGYISNVRFLSGVALYTDSTLVTSSTPLTVTENTVLLACQDLYFKDYSNNYGVGFANIGAPVVISPINPFNITNNYSTALSAVLSADPYAYNNVALITDVYSPSNIISPETTASSSSPWKQTVTSVGSINNQGVFSPFSQDGWSGNFNGSKDYIYTNTLSALPLGTDDFTIEQWVQPTYVTKAPVRSLSRNVVSIGTNHTLFLKNDGTVWASGNSIAGAFGSFGTAYYYKPVQLPITDVVSVHAGSSFSYFLKQDLSVWMCGSNANGQLGTGNQTTVLQIIKANIKDVTSIAAANQSVLFLKTDGTVWACGLNSYGALGLGSSAASSILTPTQIPGLSSIISIATSGYHSLFVNRSGNAYSCGYNGEGALGLGNSTSTRYVPTLISSLSNVVKVETNYARSSNYSGTEQTASSFFITQSGNVYACGSNQNAQLGLGSASPTTYNSPQLVTAITDIYQVSTGGSYPDNTTYGKAGGYTLFLKNDGTVYGCGANGVGNLGQGTNYSTVTSLTQIPNLSSVSFIKASAAADNSCSLFVSRTGSVSGCGADNKGAIGTNTNQSKIGTIVPAGSGINGNLFINVTKDSDIKNLIISNYNSWYKNNNSFYITAGYYSLSSTITSLSSKYCVGINGLTPEETGLYSTTNIAYGKWTHVALQKAAGIYNLLIDGDIEASYKPTSPISLSGAGPYSYIGSSGENNINEMYAGRISNLRVSKDPTIINEFEFDSNLELTSDSNTLALLNFNGPENANVFFDSSPYNWQMTATEGVSITRTSKFGKGAALFDATSGKTPRISFPSSFSSTFAPGTGPFTIEFFIKLDYTAVTDGNSAIIFSKSSSSNDIQLAVGITGPFESGTDVEYVYNKSREMYLMINNVICNSMPMQIIATGEWTHIAFTREDNAEKSIRGFVNGKLISTGTNSANLAGTGYSCAIGGFAHELNSSRSMSKEQLLDNFRISNIARYIPTNTLKSAGTWGTYFDSNYITAPRLDLGTSDFTIESWIYPLSATANNQARTIITNLHAGEFYAADPGTSPFVLYQGANSGWSFDVIDQAGVTLTAPNTVQVGKWQHVAVTRKNTLLTLYVDGLSAATYECNSTLNITGKGTFPLIIGSKWPPEAPFIVYAEHRLFSYLSNLRISLSALYSNSFDPYLHSINLSATPSTRLLLFSGPEVKDYSSNNTALTINNLTSLARDLSTKTFGLRYKTISSWLKGAKKQKYDIYLNSTSTKLSALPTTSLLALQDYEVKDVSSTVASLTTVGSPILTPFNPYSNFNKNLLFQSSFFNGRICADIPNFGISQLGTDNFTLEMWLYPLERLDSSHTPVVFMCGNSLRTSIDTGICILADWTGQSNVYTIIIQVGSGFDQSLKSNEAIVYNKWTHLCVTRQSGTFKFYLNGKLQGTFTPATNPDLTGPARIGTVRDIGYETASTSRFNIFNLSLTRQVKYLSDFDPYLKSIVPFSADSDTILLAFQNNKLQDNSKYNHSIVETQIFPDNLLNINQVTFNSSTPMALNTSTINTPLSYEGSGYFDGTNCLAIHNNNLNLYNKDFTIEFWVYKTSQEENTILQFKTDRLTQGTVIGFNANSELVIGNRITYQNSNVSVPSYQWKHIAIVKSSNTTTVYLNGKSVSSFVFAPGPSFMLYIGGADGKGSFKGYLTSLRITLDAIYNSSFVPNFNSLSALTKTVVLLNFTNPSVKDNISSYNLTPVNVKTGTTTVNASISGVLFKSGANENTGNLTFGEMPFDGTLSLNGPTDTVWTLEFWCRLNSNAYTSNLADFIASAGKAGTTTLYYVGATLNRGMYIQFGTGQDKWSGPWQSGANTSYGLTLPSLSTWHHYAFVRNGSTLQGYRDGSLVYNNAAFPFGSISFLENSIVDGSKTRLATGNRFYIGAYINDSASPNNRSWNGYISNYRLVKGAAIYTSNFTPTRVLAPATQGNTVLWLFKDGEFKDSSKYERTIYTPHATLLSSLIIPTAQGPVTTVTTITSVEALKFANTSQTNFGTNDFTIEARLKPIAVTSSYPTVFNTNPTTNSNLWSGYFDGTKFMQVSSASNNIAQLSTSNFTIEMWVYPTETNPPFGSIDAGYYYKSFLVTNHDSTHRGAITVFIDIVDGYRRYAVGLNSNSPYNGPLFWSKTKVEPNKWTHLALTRSSSRFTLFINGLIDTTYTSSGTLVLSGVNNNMAIGGNAAYDYYNNDLHYPFNTVFQGYISNLRISNKVLYAINFDPYIYALNPLPRDSSVLFLGLQDKTLSDKSYYSWPLVSICPITPKEFYNSYTSYLYSMKRQVVTTIDVEAVNIAPKTNTASRSVYFPTTQNVYYEIRKQISISSNSNATIQMWIYPIYKQVQATGILSFGPITNGLDITCIYSSTNYYNLQIGINGTYVTASELFANIAYNQWTHLALVRSSGSWYLFINGSKYNLNISYSGSINQSGTITDRVFVGTENTRTVNFLGYLCNLHIVPNRAVYTENFNPYNISIPYYTTDSTAEVLCFQDFASSQISNDAFAVKLTAVGLGAVQITPFNPPVADSLKSNMPNSAGSLTLYAGQNHEETNYPNAFTVNIDGVSEALKCNSPSVNVGLWNYVSIQRTSGTFQLHVNGKLQDTYIPTTNPILNGSDVFFVGLGSEIDPEYTNLDGVISDFRITNGVARYAGEYTVPTTGYPSV